MVKSTQIPTVIYVQHLIRVYACRVASNKLGFRISTRSANAIIKGIRGKSATCRLPPFSNGWIVCARKSHTHDPD